MFEKIGAAAPQIVAGQSAVGSVPANPPVGVSGVDGGGLKRSLLTDTTGKLNVISPDCLEVSGSVSSADVLFTVDMLNYQSITTTVTSAGTGCTITYEQSPDGTNNWVPIAGINPAVSATGGGPTSQSTGTSTITFPKRYQFFRARVSIYGSGTVSVTGEAVAGQVATSIGAICWGLANEGTNVSGSPVTMGVEARSSGKTIVSSGQVVRPIATLDGRLIMRPHSIPENEWSYAAASGGILNTTSAVTIKAAVASVRNYITGLQIHSEALTNATEVAIRDGAGGTVLWRIKVPTTGMDMTNIMFANPLKSTANTLLEVVTLTASGAGAVYVNAQGYIAP